MDVLQQLVRQGIDLVTNPKHSRWISWLLLCADGLLCGLIIRRIPYTEIDWKAYMQQIAQYRAGERDYENIKGATGPLVYPAAHVYIYDVLYRLTDEGADIFRAQCIFMVVYLAALSVVMACYRMAKAPPYILLLLILSKRLHSIFLLRLFNDCFAVLALFLAIYSYQIGFYAPGSLAFSFGVGIKMSILLGAPAVGIVLLQTLPSSRAINSVLLMAQAQVLLGLPFWTTNGKGYVGRAFQVTRQFLFKWTVNWRFVGEQIFLSKVFSMALLGIHGILLAIFILTRWLRPSGLSVPALVKTIFKPLPPKLQQRLSRNVTPDFILTSILTSMIVGLLCARSLHYQFYAYIAWSTPFLLWKTGIPSYLVYAIWAAQEWAWNVYPSTDSSSKVVVGCLAIQILGVWWGLRNQFGDVRPLTEDEVKREEHIE